MFDQMSRWVQREGKTVRFGNVVGGFAGKPYRYEFATEEVAETFEKEIVDQDGTPKPVDPKWKPFFKGQE